MSVLTHPHTMEMLEMIAKDKKERVLRTNSKEKILDAAERLVSEAGVARLTFEALSKHAGVSRGGILYNFNSKEELVAAMVARLVSRMENKAKLDVKSGQSILSAYVRGSLSAEEHSVSLSSALLIAVLNDPSLLEPVRQNYSNALSILFEGERSEESVVLALAADAIMLLDILKLTPLNQQQRKKITNYIKRQAAALAG